MSANPQPALPSKTVPLPGQFTLGELLAALVASAVGIGLVGWLGPAAPSALSLGAWWSCAAVSAGCAVQALVRRPGLILVALSLLAPTVGAQELFPTAQFLCLPHTLEPPLDYTWAPSAEAWSYVLLALGISVLAAWAAPQPSP